MSGGTGLLVPNSPPGQAVSSLHLLGKPCPDSRTNTWKLLALPRKAIPVGALRPVANIDAVNPAGRLIDGGKVGLKKAALFIQSGAVEGLATICAWATIGSARSGKTADHAARLRDSLRCMAFTPPRPCPGEGVGVIGKTWMLRRRAGHGSFQSQRSPRRACPSSAKH